MAEKIADTFVSVVAPLDNDESHVKELIKQLSHLLKSHYSNYEVVLVDNASTDNTVLTLLPLLKQHACIRLVRLSRHHDRETIIFAGLDSSIGDFVVVLIPGSDPPEVIPEIIKQLRQEPDAVDIAYGISQTPVHHSLLTHIGRRLFYWYSRRVLQANIPRGSTYLMGLNRRAVNALTRVKGRYRHIRHISSLVGFKTGQLIYQPLSTAVLKERGIREAFDLAVEIAVSYSRHPLRFVSQLGLIAGCLNLIYGLYIVVTFLLRPRLAEGWTTLSLQMTCMFFFVFLILSVLSEYVGRILEETRDQPAYHVMEELVSTALIADATRRNVTK